jgi:hypothetical protein
MSSTANLNFANLLHPVEAGRFRVRALSPVAFSLSFPRRRESIDPPSHCSTMDSRFRGNDQVNVLLPCH